MKHNKEEQEIDKQHRKELLETIKDQTEAMAPKRMAHLRQTAQETTVREPYCKKDFYLVLVKTNKRDELRQPVDLVFARLSCPTPGYNQDVFKYRHSSGELEYLWSIPRKYRYWEIYNNKLKYMYNKQTQRLASFVVAMETGELLKWVKKENGEKPDAVIKVNSPTREA